MGQRQTFGVFDAGVGGEQTAYGAIRLWSTHGSVFTFLALPHLILQFLGAQLGFPRTGSTFSSLRKQSGEGSGQTRGTRLTDRGGKDEAQLYGQGQPIPRTLAAVKLGGTCMCKRAPT